MFDYTAADDDEVSFREGNKLSVEGQCYNKVYLYHTSMFLANQIAQLQVLDFTYILPPVPFPAVENTYTTHREHLYYLRTVYCSTSWKKIRFKNFDFILSVSKPKCFYWVAK